MNWYELTAPRAGRYYHPHWEGNAWEYIDDRESAIWCFPFGWDRVRVRAWHRQWAERWAGHVATLLTRPPMRRTVCACAQCQQCCREQPGYLIPDDIEKLRWHFPALPLESVLCNSRGALVAKAGRAFWVHSITPQTRKDGACVFLDEQGRCLIHPIAPFGCAYFDTHMATSEATRRSAWGLQQVMASADYDALRKTLPLAKTHRPRRAF